MALHSDLPIFKVAYDLLDVIVGLVRNLPRDIKGVIGGELRDSSLKMLVLIFRANVSTDKAPHLAALIETAQKIELLLRLARDKHWISTKQYAAAILLTTSIGKQATGWKKKFATAPVA
jgi:hypothetical protein